MKKISLKSAVLLVAVVFLIACGFTATPLNSGSQPPQSQNSVQYDKVIVAEGVSRFIDAEMGVICYTFYAQSISCVSIED